MPLQLPVHCNYKLHWIFTVLLKTVLLQPADMKLTEKNSTRLQNSSEKLNPWQNADSHAFQKKKTCTSPMIAVKCAEDVTHATLVMTLEI